MVRFWWIPAAIAAVIMIGLMPATPAKAPPAKAPPAANAEKSIVSEKPAAAAKKPAPPVKGPQRLTVGELSAVAPAEWKSETRGSQFRLAQFTLPAAKGDAATPQFIVFYFGPGQGGTAEDNMKRWIGMVKQPDGSDSANATKQDRAEHDGLRITTLDLSGTYLDRPFPMAEESTPRPGYRFLAAVVETTKEGGQGPYFLRLVGPAGSVTAAKPAWDRLLASLKPESK